MIQNLKVVKRKSVECFELCLINACQKFEVDWPLAIYHYAKFLYTKNKPDLVVQIQNMSRDIARNIENLFGISYEALKLDDSLTAQNIIKSQLVIDRPIIIKIDPFFCSWTKEFQTIHQEHYILIIGYCSGYLCIDPIFSEVVQNLSVEQLLKGYLDVYVFHRNNTYSFNVKKPLKTLSDIIASQENDIAYSMLEDDVLRSNSLEYRQVSSSFWKLHDSLKWGYYLSGSRELFLDFLLCLRTKVPIPIPTISEWKAVTYEWHTCMDMLVKRSVMMKSVSDILKRMLLLLPREKQFFLSFNCYINHLLNEVT